MGCPIRKSMDQSPFTAPHGLSQCTTSFIASCCQGIHQTPFSRLIRPGKGKALTGYGSSYVPVPHALVHTRGTWSVYLTWIACALPDPTECPKAPEQVRPTSPHAGCQRNADVYLSSRCQSSSEPDDPTHPQMGPMIGFFHVARWRWWSLPGSNRRPPACKAGALPAELRPRAPPARKARRPVGGMVGRGGLEPPTSRLSGVRSNHLSYRPASRLRQTRNAAVQWTDARRSAGCPQAPRDAAGGLPASCSFLTEGT